MSRRRNAVRQLNRGGLGHRETLLRAAIELQGQVLDVAVRREHVRVAVIPDGGAVGSRRRNRHELQIVRRDRLLHLLARQFRQRQARLMRRPKIQRKGQLHGTVEVRRQRNLRGGQVRRCLTDEGGDLDGRAATVIDVAIAGRQRRLFHVQRLAVIAEQGRIQRDLIHPEMTGGGVAGRVVDLAPTRNGRGTRFVIFGVVHERDHVGEIALGTARRRHGRKIAVGQIARKIVAEILRRVALRLKVSSAVGERRHRRRRQEQRQEK